MPEGCVPLMSHVQAFATAAAARHVQRAPSPGERCPRRCTGAFPIPRGGVGARSCAQCLAASNADEKAEDYDELDVPVDQLLKTGAAMDRVAAALADARLSHGGASAPSLLVDVCGAHWLDLQVCYDRGARHFVTSRVLNVRTFSEFLPSDIQWHIVNVHRDAARRVVQRVPSLFAVDGVADAAVLDGLNAAVLQKQEGARSRRREANTSVPAVRESSNSANLRCAVTLAAASADDERPLRLAEHVATACPALRVAGVWFESAVGQSDSGSDGAGTDTSVQHVQRTAVADFRRAVAHAAALRRPSELVLSVPLSDNADVERYIGVLASGPSSVRVQIANFLTNDDSAAGALEEAVPQDPPADEPPADGRDDIRPKHDI